jgi:hypothetical protein
MSESDERDAAGHLTDWALAVSALEDNGCDCGDDEPGTCLACACELAMSTERKRAKKAEAEVERLKAQIDRMRAAAHRAIEALPDGAESTETMALREMLLAMQTKLRASEAEVERLRAALEELADIVDGVVRENDYASVRGLGLDSFTTQCARAALAPAKEKRNEDLGTTDSAHSVDVGIGENVRRVKP